MRKFARANFLWITVKVHPNAGKDVLVSLGPGRFEAWVRGKPVMGRANQSLIELLVRTLGVSRDQLRLVKGGQARQKVFRIAGGMG